MASPVVSLPLGILYQWTGMQMLAKPPSNFLQRTGGDHRGGHAQLGWKTFMMTCLRWILGYLRLYGAKSASLETDVFAQCYALVVGACYYWIGLHNAQLRYRYFDLLCNFFLYLCSSWPQVSLSRGQIDTRFVRAIGGLLVPSSVLGLLNDYALYISTHSLTHETQRNLPYSTTNALKVTHFTK